VDVIGDARADRYKVALGGALRDPGVDGVLVILTPQSMTDIENIAEEVCNTAGEFEKPVYASFMGEKDVAVGIDILQQRSIPHYVLPESMCRAFASALFFKHHRDTKQEEIQNYTAANREQARAVIQRAIAAGRNYLPEEESVTILEAYGLPTLPSGLAKSRQEAVSIAERIGFPVVMKVDSDDIVHKFDVKGVLLDVRTAEAAGEGYDSILANVELAKPGARIKGIYLQKMVSKGEEVILGVKRDPSFGVVIMFGLGGLFVEVFKDVSFRVAPIGPRSASEMIREIRAYSMLAGARGKNPRDIRSIEECIQRVAALALDNPEIKELDINPLIVNDEGGGCYVADARIML